MFIDSQRLGYKINPIDHKYSKQVHENLSASRGTFTDLETPGWTSLMRSQMSDLTKRNVDKQMENKQIDIYNKLNQGERLQWSEADQKKMLRSKQTYDKNDTRDTGYTKPQSLAGRQTSRQITKKQNLPKRWNQITVHEHLYKQSVRLENKRVINKILDQEYKKKQIFKFTPTINKKSIILAESKFSRTKQTQFSPKKNQNTIQTQASNNKQKEDKEVQRYRILNRTFYYLSSGKTLLTQQSLKSNLLQLPLPCIDVIQPIVKKIFTGEQMEWLDFLQNFNDKNLKGKQKFYTIIQKWFFRLQNTENTKQNNQQNSTQ